MGEKRGRTAYIMDPQIFDPVELLDLVGDDQTLLHEVVDIAIEQIHGQAAVLETMLEDRVRLARSAHLLRGVLLSLFAEEATAIAASIEANAVRPGIKVEIDALDVALARLETALRRFRTTWTE